MWFNILIGVIGYIIITIIQNVLIVLFLKGVRKIHCLYILLSYIPFLRGATPYNGKWNISWSTDGETLHFTEKTDSYAQAQIRMLWGFIHVRCDFRDSTENENYQYCFFGIIKNQDYIVGHWYDVHDSKGYYGVFEVKISDKNNFSGRWLGHSKGVNGNSINSGTILFKKITYR